MPSTEFSAALNQLAAERGISVEAVLETVKQALAAAYKKDSGPIPTRVVEKEGEQVEEEVPVEVQLDPETGEAKVFVEGKDVTPAGFGRIAAQTAKQVILQRIREEEKSALREEYEKKQGTIASGSIFRVDKGVVFVDLGKAQGVLPPAEQIPREEYQTGRRTKVLVKAVQEGMRGPEILLSRTDPDFIKELFALEVPEIPAGVVKIELIAREAGQRTKMAVTSTEEKVDPVGSCVGQKGVRVQAVTRELGEEKVDIVPYSHDEATFIASALSPAKVIKVKLKKKSHTAEVEVPENQLSLAIGREGQNVRLAAKLTGWRIDIKGAGKAFAEGTLRLGAGQAGELEKLGLSKRTITALEKAGITSADALKAKTEEELKAIKGLGPKAIAEIKKAVGAPKAEGKPEEEEKPEAGGKKLSEAKSAEASGEGGQEEDKGGQEKQIPTPPLPPKPPVEEGSKQEAATAGRGPAEGGRSGKQEQPEESSDAEVKKPRPPAQAAGVAGGEDKAEGE